jgi:tetratricopeptide (TPR) repeat protein
LGRVYAARGEFLLAAEAFEQAVALLPEAQSYYARLELADQYRALGRLEDAAAQLNRALGIDPTNEQAYLRMGKLYESQQSFDLAERWYRRGTELGQAAGPAAWVALAELYEATGRASEATSAWRQVLEIAPGHPDAPEQLGEGR